MDDLYKQNILDHYRHPRHVGTLPEATHSHEANNPLCGDKLRLDLQINADDVIENVAFQGRGCAISQASASMLTEMLVGKTLAEAKQIDKQVILDTLGIDIGPVRLKCALLSLKTLKMALYGLSDDEE